MEAAGIEPAQGSRRGRDAHECSRSLGSEGTRATESPRMERAQDTFKQMMRDKVAPALRELGFKGSGQSFTLPSDSHWALLGFQKSAFGDSQEVRFTINLTVVGRRAWDEATAARPYLGTRPAPNVSHGPPAWSERIGFLLPERTDLWWSVPAGASTDTVVEDVVTVVRDCALPEMRRQIEGAADARKPRWTSS
jgi:hypothetical protein